LGLVFVHLPVPHAPYIFQRKTGEFAHTGDSSYFDNLVLADRAFGEIRRTMEDAGMWNITSIVVTADHGYRTELWRNKIPPNGEEARIIADTVDTRVPFMLKVAGHTTGVKYTPRLNIIRAPGLVLELLGAQITNVASALEWLEQDRKIDAAPVASEPHAGDASACVV
jgi:hypothetical protein